MAASNLWQATCHLQREQGTQEAGVPGEALLLQTKKLRPGKEACCPRHMQSGGHAGPSGPRCSTSPLPPAQQTETHTRTCVHTTVWAPSPPLPGVTRSLSEGGGITLAWQTSQALDVPGENATEELGRCLRYLIMFSSSNYSDEGRRPRRLGKLPMPSPAVGGGVLDLKPSSLSSLR